MWLKNYRVEEDLLRGRKWENGWCFIYILVIFDLIIEQNTKPPMTSSPFPSTTFSATHVIVYQSIRKTIVLQIQNKAYERIKYYDVEYKSTKFSWSM